MELRKLSLERYKGYAEPVEIELAPLTILVGANNAGKTALAQAIQFICGGTGPFGKRPIGAVPAGVRRDPPRGILSRIW